VDGDLKRIGVKVVQEDGFFVEPAVTPQEETVVG
jgi:hypothetical protein